MIDHGEYIRIERVYKGKIFLSLERGGKRCFPLSKAGIQNLLEMIADVGVEKPKAMYLKMYAHEPDIWDAIFEHTGEADADIFIKRFNIEELPPKGKART